jgi:hypothetical protein
MTGQGRIDLLLEWRVKNHGRTEFQSFNRAGLGIFEKAMKELGGPRFPIC